MDGFAFATGYRLPLKQHSDNSTLVTFVGTCESRENSTLKLSSTPPLAEGDCTLCNRGETVIRDSGFLVFVSRSRESTTLSARMSRHANQRNDLSCFPGICDIYRRCISPVFHLRETISRINIK